MLLSFLVWNVSFFAPCLPLLRILIGKLRPKILKWITFVSPSIVRDESLIIDHFRGNRMLASTARDDNKVQQSCSLKLRFLQKFALCHCLQRWGYLGSQTPRCLTLGQLPDHGAPFQIFQEWTKTRFIHKNIPKKTFDSLKRSFELK